MKFNSLVVTILVVVLSAIFQGGLAQNPFPGIIPQPVSIAFHDGRFLFNSQTEFVVPEGRTDVKELADLLVGMLTNPLGYQPVITIRKDQSQPAIWFVINDTKEKALGNEGYRLEVDPKKVQLIANEPAGLFYGFQTLMQLLPPEIEGDTSGQLKTWDVPAVSISDNPRFKWRGLMLDVSRHFFTVEEVKRYIDQMVKYKFNVFHWHLSDDQGWRVEIKSLPKLTEIGAWRVPRTGVWWSFDPPKENEKATEGGFYTHEQIREVVKYAADRYVTILPEIDVPGHSLAMIASYPELSSTGKKYPVNPGSKFYTIEDNSLCPGKEKVFEVLDKVFTEVAELFPGEYIHIGGDECNKSFWKDSPECLTLIKREKIADMNELQSWFIKHLEKILKEKGKKMIGWDEILEGGLAPEATVMSWRGMDGGIQAAKMGHHVIMTPTTHCYLDLYQGDPSVEPVTYSMLRLSDVYRFEPVPDDVNPELILGGQGNLWTESVAVYRHAEYMTWPRGMALAEVLWSPKSVRNWDDFIFRMDQQFDRFDHAGVNYARSAYDPIIKMTSENGNNSISITAEISGLDIHYSFDESYPDQFYPRYDKPLEIPAGASRIRVVAVQDGKIVSKQINIELKELIKRGGK
ncbi:MAG: family 20 glycosylhydrolase [Bacteroidia bacterium]|nr:family 20 glycosylhydrolase [Bacteroidia bacterium]